MHRPVASWPTGRSFPDAMTLGASGSGFTVSIVSHGQAAHCAQLLADLAQHAPAAVSKIVLTLNLPEPAPHGAALPFAVEVLRNAHPKGFGANHNQAFARCQSEFFAVLNPDLRFAQDPFTPLGRCLADPTVGIAAPVVREADGTVADFARPLVSPWDILHRRLQAPTPPDLHAEPDWIAGMFLAFRRSVYADLGGFDARYFLYCEDVDICARVRLRGLHLRIAPDVSVTHMAQRASRRSLTRMGRHVVSLMRLWSSPAYRQYRELLRAQPAKN